METGKVAEISVLETISGLSATENAAWAWELTELTSECCGELIAYEISDLNGGVRGSLLPRFQRILLALVCHREVIGYITIIVFRCNGLRDFDYDSLFMDYQITVKLTEALEKRTVPTPIFVAPILLCLLSALGTRTIAAKL